jgi:hypothetical protein
MSATPFSELSGRYKETRTTSTPLITGLGVFCAFLLFLVAVGLAVISGGTLDPWWIELGFSLALGPVALIVLICSFLRIRERKGHSHGQASQSPMSTIRCSESTSSHQSLKTARFTSKAAMERKRGPEIFAEFEKPNDDNNLNRLTNFGDATRRQHEYKNRDCENSQPEHIPCAFQNCLRSEADASAAAPAGTRRGARGKEGPPVVKIGIAFWTGNGPWATGMVHTMRVIFAGTPNS